MVCPKCGGQMDAERRHSVEFERCSSCKGIWVERYSLAVALGDPGRANEFDWSGRPTEMDEGHETGFHCAACERPLIARHTRGIEIDVCRGCGGIFLDHSELESLRDSVRRDARHERLGNVVEGGGEAVGEVAGQFATDSALNVLARALQSILS